MALPGAVPLGGATIEIYSLGGGASEGEALAQGRTEDDGSWCVRSAEALEARSGLLVEVSYESGDGMTRRLRRITFDPRAATVGPLSEAQVRVVEDCGVGLSSVTRARWTNLETMVATTVAVFDPMVIRSDESSDSVIERAVRALRADPRIGAAMSEMEGCTLEE
jgi:hypothetical protein